MKISSKMERCGLSPMRKFNPYAQKVKERGIKIYHLNIGQPDVETPAPFFDALKAFDEKVVSYAPSGGIPVYLDAVRDYYRRIGVELERGDMTQEEYFQKIVELNTEESKEVLQQ